jgi:hypothetical protein
MFEQWHVERVFFLGAIGKGTLATGMSVQLHEKTVKSAPWGEGLSAAHGKLHIANPSELALEPVDAPTGFVGMPSVELPLRDTDASPFTGGSKYLFPFSPRWSSAF